MEFFQVVIFSFLYSCGVGEGRQYRSMLGFFSFGASRFRAIQNRRAPLISHNAFEINLTKERNEKPLEGKNSARGHGCLMEVSWCM